MDAEDDFIDMPDEDDEDEDDDDDVEEDYVMNLEPEPTSSLPKSFEEEYHYEVLTADQLVKHMIDCIKEVNTVVQVFKYFAFLSLTVIRNQY